MTERTVIDRPAAEVWPAIVTPELYKKWNEKVVWLSSEAPFEAGRAFAIRYRMSGKEIQGRTTVVAAEAPRLLELRHSDFIGREAPSPDLVVLERITLSESGGRTTVTKLVDVRGSHLPWWAVPLVWFVTRFGRPAGPNRLKRLFETAG